MTGNNPHIHEESRVLRQGAEAASESLPALWADAENAVASVLHGDHPQSKPGMGEKFWQYREYAPGDRPQDIDWRQTAKTEHVFIRQKEWQTTQTAILWCSQSAGMGFSSRPSRYPSKAQAARVLTLALALMMTRAGEQIGSFGARKTGRSENALLDLALKLTEDIRSVAPLPDPDLYDLPPHAFFVQAGDFLEPLERIEENFKQFSGQSAGGLVVQVLDPAELSLPYDGRVLFRNMAQEQTLRIDNVASVRKAYQQRIAAHNDALHQLCKEHHWHHVLHRTDRPYADTLSTIWAMLSYDPAGGRQGGAR